MIHLLRIGSDVALETADELAAALARELRESCHVRPEPIDPSFAFDPVRNQYHATSILRAMTSMTEGERLLGIASVDLYVPIFTFVFGEAQVSGRCALISLTRLRQEYYGLPSDRRLTAERLLKEALHELGHTYGLRHCHDWSCPMASSTSIERMDLKNRRYCLRCHAAVRAASYS
ncbi:MAG: archaemetzincin family Zn-dependent metalloprotease [Acidobacteria bacterium]|nr:archaemetzincin family Zn-dependent metalloprotease [Acidobacteriota bacterium]